MRRFVLAFLVSIVTAAAAGEICQNQIILVKTEWTLPWTNYAAGQFCVFTFKLPANNFAVVEFEGQNVNGTYSYIYDNFGNSVDYAANIWAGEMGFDSVSKENVFPDNFQLVIQTKSVDTLLLNLKITAHEATPQSNVIGQIFTDLNVPSTSLNLDNWSEGRSFTITSLKNKISLLMAVENAANRDELENVFIYEGGVLVGTLMNAGKDVDYTSKTNEITLYMTNRLNTKQTLLITDSSNLDPFFLHLTDYVPSYNGTAYSSVAMGGHFTPGAVTLVNNRDTSKPITLVKFDIQGPPIGEMSVLSGGPLADFSGARTIRSEDLPMTITGDVNTFYISEGQGVIYYT